MASTGAVDRLIGVALLCAAVLPAQYTQWVTHGPMLGRPGPRSMGVWVRTAKPGAFYVRYGTAPDRLTQSKAGSTSLEADLTGWTLLEGLQPNTRYHYSIAFTADGEPASAPGSFKTLPSPEVTRHPKTNPDGLYNFTFEFACGNNQSPRGNGPALPVFRTMMDRVASKLDFALLNGDWLYEERRGHTLEAWMAENGIAPSSVTPLLRLIPTVAGVWENYKLYLSRGKNLSEWHRNVPSYYTFDDHEILNDVFGAGEIGLRNRRAVFRDIATKAWYDYLGWSNPVPWKQGIVFGRAQLQAGSDVLTDSSADFTKIDLKQLQTLHVHWGGPNAGSNEIEEPGNPDAGVYRVAGVLDRSRLRIEPAPKADTVTPYSIGRLSYFSFPMSNAEFFVLDARSHRNLHDLKHPDKHGISLLGRDQKQWVKDAMSRSRAQFLFVVSSVNFMFPHTSSGGEGNKDDAWTAFLEEREEMIRFWDSLGKTVLILTGDIHMSYTIKITDRVWEVASGPHNSPHHPVGSKGFPPNGEFDSRGRKCDVRWTSYIANDTDKEFRRRPLYTLVQVNNVFTNPDEDGKPRWLRWPRAHVSIQHYDGRTGDLLYAETVQAAGK